MSSVTSKDGTTIAWQASGKGPPLVLVHGTSADQARWAPVLPRLNERFTVWAVDRRGRGQSGDGSAYASAREAEDIAAVVDAAPQPVVLLGHSYGGFCSLEAMLLTRNVRKLVLYEPPIPVGGPIFPPGIVARLQALAQKGDREGALDTFFLEIVCMSAPDLAMLKKLPNWAARVAAAPTIPREMAAVEAYVFEPARFAGLSVPTLLLVGGDSLAYTQKVTQAVHAALKTSRVAVLPGQQHVAMNTAPELFLREVLAFVDE